jgi:hypothetical protein
MDSSQLPQSHSMAGTQIGTSTSQSQLPAQTQSPMMILVMKATILLSLIACSVALGGLVVSMLVTGTKVRELKPGQ